MSTDTSLAFVVVHTCLCFSVDSPEEVFYAFMNQKISTKTVLELLLGVEPHSVHPHSMEGPLCFQKTAPSLWQILAPQNEELAGFAGPIESVAHLRGDRSASPVLQDDGSPKDPEERAATFRTLHLTKREVSFLIGRNGDRLNGIRFGSGCIIKVKPIGDRIRADLKSVRIKDMPQDMVFSGTPDQVFAALSQTMILLNKRFTAKELS